MTLKSGTGQACAACKYQRRRCTPECLLAPFFPADQPKMFQNVHKLFGVKHIQNLLKQLNPESREMAMRSIKFHAMMRDKYPVYGCLYEIQNLSYQIQLAEEELHSVLQQLAFYRQQQQQQQQQKDNNNMVVVAPVNDSNFSQLQLGIDNNSHYNNNGLNAAAAGLGNITNNTNNHNPDFNNNNNNNCGFLEAKDSNVVDPMWLQQTCNDSVIMQSQVSMSMSQHHLAVQDEASQDYSEVRPFFDNFDDRQSFIGSKETGGAATYESSSFESSVKGEREAVEQIAENELKSAAACFSLTSVN